MTTPEHFLADHRYPFPLPEIQTLHRALCFSNCGTRFKKKMLLSVSPCCMSGFSSVCFAMLSLEEL